MTRSIYALAFRTAIAITGLSLAIPVAALAQGGDGFLFKQPRVAIKFETGYGFQRAQSDVFDFTLKELTVGRRDFDSPYVGGEIAVRASERWDVAIGFGYQSSSVSSEFRDFVDLDDLPIEQVTELTLIPVTVRGKYYLRDRGRSIGRFAWIPTMIAPFVGAGVGVTSYRFVQTGDFVAFDTYDISFEQYVSAGQAFLGRALAGVDISVDRQFLFTLEARYGWASGALDETFSGFDKMDLNGLQLVGGISVRF